MLKRELIPRALVITPNLHEAAALLDAPVAANEDAMREQAQRAARARRAGGADQGRARQSAESVDLLVDAIRGRAASPPNASPRNNTHGTGCTLSSAIAAGLAKGLRLAEAVRAAKAYVTAAIAAADELKIGPGHGPVHHFHAWW